MSIIVLGSHEVVTAFALGGLIGRVVRNRADVLAALEDLSSRQSAEVLVIQQEFSDLAGKAIDRLRLDPLAPLIVEVSGFSGPSEGRRTARDIVKKALGIRL